MSIESAKDVSVISEHTEIASQKATVQTVEAALSVAEAHISAETLQQTNITETSITGAAVQDMGIESAKDVSVISEHTKIVSQKATVQTVEATLSAAEAHISAETLQQTNITETSIIDAVVGEMKTENIYAEKIFVQYVVSGKAETSADSLAPSTSGWIGQAQQTPVPSMAAADDAGQAVTLREEMKISGSGKSLNFFQKRESGFSFIFTLCGIKTADAGL
ncbi:uncharacterized protein LOC120337407 [Styela clava]